MSNSTLSSSADRQFTPKYVDLARTLIRRIAKEGLSVGDRLGTEEGLGEQYGLSRVTVRQALELLENEGYVARKRARGTFVTREVRINTLCRRRPIVSCWSARTSRGLTATKTLPSVPCCIPLSRRSPGDRSRFNSWESASLRKRIERDCRPHSLAAIWAGSWPLDLASKTTAIFFPRPKWSSLVRFNLRYSPG